MRTAVDLLLSGDVVLTVDAEGTTVPNGSVAIRGGRIVDVGQRDDLVSRYTRQTLSMRRGA
jgi:predicted amidohydrolase YtcJ